MEDNTYREKLESLGFRARTPKPKITDERDSDGSGYTITNEAAPSFGKTEDDVQHVAVTPKTLNYEFAKVED